MPLLVHLKEHDIMTSGRGQGDAEVSRAKCFCVFVAVLQSPARGVCMCSLSSNLSCLLSTTLTISASAELVHVV